MIVDVVESFRRVHLESREARLALPPHCLADGIRAVATDPVVDPHPIASRPTEQGVDGHAERTRRDLPERLLDARGGTRQHRPTAVEATPM